ncbi:MAG: hypothetical protein GVY16_06585 [Planctomycetes bacterium]|jgi:hypothetical protein|nr:hypothetical protein [Planctomycetota bacterium]
MNLLGRLLNVYLKHLDRQLRAAAGDPVAAQQQQLRQLLRTARRTAFGRKHAFKAIRSHDDFRKAVPIRDYVAMLPWVEQMLDGRRNVSWPGTVRYFAQTSGTTAGDKRIPVTRDMQRSNRRAALAIFAFYERRGRGNAARLMDGKLLFLGGSTSMTPTGSGGWIGDLSGIATQQIHWPLTTRYEPGPQIALIDNWETKIDRVAERCGPMDITLLTGMPSWCKVLFDRLVERRGIDTTGAISRIWPRLRLFVHGGVNFEPYRATFEQYVADDHELEFLEVYPASEGFVAVQPEAGGPMEMLTDNGLFYEFVPLSQWGQPDAPRLGIGEVDIGVPYSLVLSTNAGLWAYDIGDVVEFVSTRPPRIRFAGRNKQFINAFGENIIAQDCSRGVAHAAEVTGAAVREFTAAPIYAGHGRKVGAHEYVVEFEREPEDLDAFAAALDARLQEVCVDYSVKRRGDAGMTPAEVTPVPPDTFYQWMKNRGKLGGQNKVPVCANDRRYVGDLREMSGHPSG